MLTYLCILRDTLYYTRFFLQHQWTSWGRSREADSTRAFTTASKAKFVVVKSGFSLLLILDEGRSKILHIAYLYTIYLLLIYLSIANVLYLVVWHYCISGMTSLKLSSLPYSHIYYLLLVLKLWHWTCHSLNCQSWNTGSLLLFQNISILTSYIQVL